MKVESRGIPPYIIWSAGIPEIPNGHPGYRDDFLSALELIFDLTDAGLFRGPQQVKPDRIVDSTGAVVFSTDDPNDIALLRLIDESKLGFTDIELISSKAE